MTLTVSSPATTIRAATPADAPEVARTLARAFYDDAVSRWIVADRPELLEPLWELSLRRMWVRHGGVVMTGDARAAAVWLPPHAIHVPVLEQLRLLPAFARCAGRALPRMLSGIGAFEKDHPHEPHWYLNLIAVEPAAQGRGLGSELLDHTLDRLDGDGMPAYLDATSERNRALYERHGFVVTAEDRMPKGGPPFWRMWRSPAAVAAA